VQPAAIASVTAAMSSRPIVAVFLVAAAVLASLLGGCTQRMAVEGRSDRLYAEAKGALISEGFRPVGRAGAVAGAEGSDPRSGRLQFLYWGDTVSPTVVEVQITAAQWATVPASASNTGVVAAPGDTSSEKVAAPAPSISPALLGAHQVMVKAWSSMTFAPDPFIADLAMGVLRRAYTLSGNAP